MTEPKWLTLRTIKAIHAESIAAFGGSSGLRDLGLLECALQRPRHRWHYGDDPSIFELAAAYCFGIIANHPFAEGNKRAGLLAANAFLDLNGYAFRPDEAEAVSVFLGLAAGEIGEADLGRWLAENAAKKRP